MPVEGTCHSCKGNVLWGDLIRFKRGCYQKISQVCAPGFDSLPDFSIFVDVKDYIKKPHPLRNRIIHNEAIVGEL